MGENVAEPGAVIVREIGLILATMGSDVIDEIPASRGNTAKPMKQTMGLHQFTVEIGALELLHAEQVGAAEHGTSGVFLARQEPGITCCVFGVGVIQIRIIRRVVKDFA